MITGNPLLVPVLLVLVVSCSGPDTVRTQAVQTGFHEQTLDTGIFNIFSMQRVRQTGGEVTIYIEGDGKAFINRGRVSNNPTPDNPLGLKLALVDNSNNVIYLARPCQFVKLSQESRCLPVYWTVKRAAPEIIEAMDRAINNLKMTYGFDHIRLVGYSGGATVAAVLAATRSDITDLRTVAGNLDIDRFVRVHDVTPLTGSVNPTAYAAKLVSIPQLHFLGANDSVITPDIFIGYTSALKQAGPSVSCLSLKTVTGMSHNGSWEAIWPDLNRLPVSCKP